MAAPSTSARLSAALDRTSHWVFSQEIPTDVVIQIGDAKFPLHKFLLVAKSGYIRRKIMESERPDLALLDLSAIPGGGEAFERAAKFCYGVNFEISVHNAAALRCAAEFLEMNEDYCADNLAGRIDEFLDRAALKNLTGSVAVLRSCEAFFAFAEEIGVVQRCIAAISLKACNEINFPTRSPPEWWATELAAVGPSSFQKIIDAMRVRGASSIVLATAVSAYAEKSLPGLVSAAVASPDSNPRHRAVLESIVSVLPADRDAPLRVGFLCCLLRAAIFLEASAACRRELERRVSAALDQASVGDLLTVAFDYGGDRVADLDSVRRVVAGFVEREMGGGGALYGGGVACCSAAAQKVARTMDAFICEIATDENVSVSKFAGIASALPISARRFDDDIYRAVDIYLKAHPGLDEIEREKVCSVIDPLKLSYEARLHASQNKRLPLQIVLHALYYDQLKLRSGTDDDVADITDNPAATRSRAVGDASLMRENEELRAELTRMKMYVSDHAHKSEASGSSKGGSKKPTFLSSMSKKLGKLNPFGKGSKDTSSAEVDRTGVVEGAAKPRRRRFSIS